MKSVKLENVQIVLDTCTSAPGSQLTGKIVLPPEATSPEAAIGGIQVVFEGQEETQVTYQESSSSSYESHEGPSTHTVTVKECHKVCSLVLIDKTYAKGRLVEKRTFGFQTTLPDNLPSSTTLGWPDNVGLGGLIGSYAKWGLAKKSGDGATLTYKIKVTISRRGLLKRDLCFEQPVEVAQPPRAAPAAKSWKHVPKVDPKQRKFLCCLGNGGRIYIAARLPMGTNVQLGQNLPVDLSVINDSNIAIERIELSLCEHIQWHARGHKQTLGGPLVSKSIMNPAPESAPPLDRSRYEMIMKRELSEAKHRQILAVPNSCKPDFQGKLMEVHHVLTIHAQTGKWSGPSDIKVPIALYPPSSTPPISTNGTVVPGLMVPANVPHIPQEPPSTTPACYPHVVHAAPVASHVSQAPTPPCLPHVVPAVPAWATTPAPHLATPAPPPAVPPTIEGVMGRAEIWQGAPVPPAKGVGRWMLKTMLGCDPDFHIKPPPPIPFVQAPATRPTDVSVSTLRAQLATFPDPVSLVNQHLRNPMANATWYSLLASLSPKDFGDIIGAVPRDVQQAPLAERLVPMIPQFSTQHLLEAIRQAQCFGVRNRMLMTTAAYCVDATNKQSKRRLKAELNDIEWGYFDKGVRNGRLCG